jgi:hypothetical protein
MANPASVSTLTAIFLKKVLTNPISPFAMEKRLNWLV